MDIARVPLLCPRRTPGPLRGRFRHQPAGALREGMPDRPRPLQSAGARLPEQAHRSRHNALRDFFADALLKVGRQSDVHACLALPKLIVSVASTSRGDRTNGALFFLGFSKPAPERPVTPPL